ncbi:MAG TPA: hypothetical protein VLN48_02830 [Bryobacteraceae bacterium]|nr:hypothetical protein [Bryobacteraceae bacterium]
MKEFRKRQDEEKEIFGADYSTLDLICARPDGSVVDPDVFSSDVIEFLKKIGLKGISFHKLRHYAGFRTIPGAMGTGRRNARQCWVSAHPRAPSPGIVWSQVFEES